MDNKTHDTSDAQQQEAFRRHLDRASDIVNGWPSWKKAVVGQVTHENPPAEQTNKATECNNNNNNNNNGGNGK